MTGDGEISREQPSVGNVLGFSLLFRQRRALLMLERRSLGPGIRISDYEAEITGVSLPLSGPLSANRFRHHRCLAKQITVSIDAPVLKRWLLDKLQAAPLAGIEVRTATVEFPEHQAPRLSIEGRTRRGALAWLHLRLQLIPRGHALAVRPTSMVLVGTVDATAQRLWAEVSARLAPECTRGDAELRIDPVFLAVARPFAASGWKAPDASKLRIRELSCSRHTVELMLHIEGPQAPPTPATADTTAGPSASLDEARAHLVAGDRDGALERLHTARSETNGDPMIELAIVRWLAEVSRHHDRAVCLAATRRWLELDAGDDDARRMLVSQLALTGSHAELCRAVAATCRLPHPPRQQARLELALAMLLTERLHDPAGALTLLDPLVDRLRDRDDLTPLLPPALVATAKARTHLDASDPSAALEPLNEALELITDGTQRAEMNSSVARGFLAAGAPLQAQALMLRACREAPDDDDVLDQTIEISLDAGDRQAAVALLEQRITRAEPTTAGLLHRQLIELLAEQTEPPGQQQALEHVRQALQREPQARDLLQRAWQLEQAVGTPTRALEHLQTLIELERDPAERTRLRLEQARLLQAGQDAGEAWRALAPALDEAPGEMVREVLSLALDVAPEHERDAVVARLRGSDDGSAGGQLLLERALLDPPSHRRAQDLRTAAQLLDDPRQALRALAEMAAIDDPQPWIDLADTCRRLDDAPGELEARFEAAMRQLERNRPELALPLLHPLRERFPRHQPSRLAEVAARMATNATEQALESLEQLLVMGFEPPRALVVRLGLDPDPGGLQLLAGKLCLELRRPQQAADWLGKARELAPEGSTVGLEAAQRLVDVLADAGQRERAQQAALYLADRCEGQQRGEWLVRAAGFADPSTAAPLLREALDLGLQGRSVLDAYERALRVTGDFDGLEDVLRRRLATATDPGVRLRILERWIGFIREHGRGTERAPLLIELYGEMLQRRPSDPELMLELAQLHDAQQQREAATKLWSRALQHLEPDDPRGFAPAMRAAEAAMDQFRPGDAKVAIERAVALRPHDREALERLAEISRAVGDSEAARRAAEGLLGLATDDQERAVRQLALARSDREVGKIEGALTRLRAAGEHVELGSPLHVEIAEAWLETATLPDRQRQAGEARTKRRLREEAAARAELRRARGASLPPLELRNEVRVLVELGRFEEATAILERGLSVHPSHELLISSFKEVTAASGELERYLEVLHRAVADLTPGEQRDRLATELAFSAMEVEDAERVLAALEYITSDRAATPELLDLRVWAVRSLGQEEQELAALRRKLLASPRDRALVTRLQRTLGNTKASVDYLLALAERVEDDAALPLGEAALACACEGGDAESILRSLQTAARHGASTRLSELWPQCEMAVLADGDEAALATLVEVATSLEAKGSTEFGGHARRLLEQGLARLPDAHPLHRALWSRLERQIADPEQRLRAAKSVIARIADEHRLSTKDWTLLHVGLAELLDRRSTAELLEQSGRLALADPEARSVVLSALERGDHWPELLRLLELEASKAELPEEKVEVYKRLAHVCGDVLNDSVAATRHLEVALDHAPDDPDLLLALLDHYYARTELDRAIELTGRVLDRVPMGDAAFIALAHRAVDAAFARNDLDLARQLLERAASRSPEDARTKARLQELAGMAGEPEARIELLASIAHRQGGSARIEALEERARLLIDPLERIDEAIVDLQHVVEEAPERQESVQLLADLYRQQQRWTDLVALLEAGFSRLRGPERSKALIRIAEIQREHLQDLSRAEQTLRLAAESLGSPPADEQLADQIHRQLVDSLQQQGRHQDLAVHLEAELEPELEGRVDPEQLDPARIVLLTQLARLLRDELDEEGKAALVFERLERLGHLPDDGLAALARWYRSRRRYRDLVRILKLRAGALQESGDLQRKAAIDRRIAELLDGPLGRPHEAARYWLEAYLADPDDNALAGARARVLFSGTDSVVNVRSYLHERLESLEDDRRPVLLTLLADVLAPHDEYEREAETTYREAIRIDRHHATAHEGLGRLLARQGRLSLAVDPLCAAARNPATDPAQAADDAAIAARALYELGRPVEAERILQDVLERARDAQRALLELARLYHRLERPADESGVLDQLSELPLSSMLKAEVAYRRAMLLEPQFSEDPLSPAGERARAHLLESVSADSSHVAARQALLELARKRGEWSTVAHMHYLSIRELSPGPQRALVHLDLAETYLVHLDDVESALRNIESAIQQAPSDVVVVNRIAKIVAGMKQPDKAAERFEQIASGENELDDAARARLWLLAADLRMQQDDVAGAEAASQKVLGLEQAPEEVATAAHRRLDSMQADDAHDLRRQKSGLLRLLGNEEQPAERLHILARLRDIGQALGDESLVDRANVEQLQVAHDLARTERDPQAVLATLRELFAEPHDYASIVPLYEALAERAEDPDRAVDILLEAARFAWHGLQSVEATVAILRKASSLRPERPDVEALLADVAKSADPAELQEYLHEELASVDPRTRTPELSLQLADVARRLGRHEEAVDVLRMLLNQTPPPPVRLRALIALDAALERIGQPPERIRLLHQAYELAEEHAPERVGDLAHELATLQHALGALEDAAATCKRALTKAPDHEGLLRLHVDLLEREEAWPELANTFAELAESSLDDEERAKWLIRLARLHLEHPELEGDRDRAMATARSILRLASEAAPNAMEPRRLLISNAFEHGRWDEVIALGEEIRQTHGDDVDVLMLAAVAQAFARNDKTLAAQIGTRHEQAIRQQHLWPGLRKVLGLLATEGPLPRLDAILAAASELVGGGYPLLRDLRAFIAGRPLHPGLALASARLFEASGEADMARYLYQLSAFMAPRGPIPSIIARIPDPQLPPDPLQAPGWSSLAEQGALRTALIRLRPYLVGIRGPGGRLTQPSTSQEIDLLARAEHIVGRWRGPLGVALPLAFTSGTEQGPVGVHNESEPCIVVAGSALELGDAELRFRLAMAAATIALGLAIVRDPQPASLRDLLDALGQLVNPAHQPRSPAAQAIADALVSRGVQASNLDPEFRRALTEELVHWTVEAGALSQLQVVLTRSEVLLGTRLSGRLDGALHAFARDQGLASTGETDPTELLHNDLARWLLRTLGLN